MNNFMKRSFTKPTYQVKKISNKQQFSIFNKKFYLTESKITIDSKIHKPKKYVCIGDCLKEIKAPKFPEKVPRGYLKLYNNSMKDSQVYLKYLRWLMQKDQLSQDSFLIGSPPGSFRRNLALSYAELTQREVEYLCLTKDTTESDIKQRREIKSNSVIYVNQCAVNAALNGRILIIEGIEKAERNLLPILNNLLENRELNLDDGHFLTSPKRFDKLLTKAKESNNLDELENLNLLRVHQDFRVIAIGLPVPKYRGNSLDPPLRSRFQAHLVCLPTYEDYFKYLTSKFKNVDQVLIKNLCNFGFSFYTNEMSSLNLPDFPLENLDKILGIIDKCNSKHLSIGNLINKIYPFKFIFKDEPNNKKFYFELMKKFDLTDGIELNKLTKTKSSNLNEINRNNIKYEFISIEEDNNTQKLLFKTNNKLVTLNLPSGGKNRKYIRSSSFIMNDYHASELVDMMLNHASGNDFCLIGNQGSGKTELIKQFAYLLNYNVQTIFMHKDMNARDFFQHRITLNDGDTKWQNSSLVEAALKGDLAVLDGIHRLRDDTIMFLRRLIQDRDVELFDGTRLLSSDKYDALKEEMKKNDDEFEQLKIFRIHPSFRVIATADPPIAKVILKNGSEVIEKKNLNQSTEWLNSEILNLFLFQSIEPLDATYEYKILREKFKLNSKHEKLIELIRKLRDFANEERQLQDVSRSFSLRKLIKFCNKIDKYPDLDLRKMIENASLYKFMPQLNKKTFCEFLDKNCANEIDLIKEIKELVFSQEKQNINNHHNFYKNNQVETLTKMSQVPDSIFFENKFQTLILNNMVRDFELGEHLLLIGNQGTGKNKLTDKFLMLTKKTREYIQLHRDTTVHSLTVQPMIKSGKVFYEDSPLVKAVKNGNVLVIDEADKAPLHVTCILKSLIESNEMILSDGRRIVSHDYNINSDENNQNLIKMNKDFRIIILANRPGFPFLGNDFFAILGDLLSCHPIDNPDSMSEIEMIRMYAPNLPQSTLKKLVNAFSQLRKLSDQGIISYPYSTREIVNIVKHLENFPQDSLTSVLANVYDFDHFAEHSDLKNTFKDVMKNHGIQVEQNFQETKKLEIEIFNSSPNKELRSLKGAKHGKVDEKNEAHVGGNQWAGGSGGFDTAGLGGVGGPYRLDSGHKVFQVSDHLKEQVPESVRKAAREIAQKAFHERLREIHLSEFEHKIYTKYLENVKKPIQQMRNILNELEEKQKERDWLKNQSQGDLDDSKLVEAVIGEKNVYRRRGDDLDSNFNSFQMKKPKRLKLVVDVSGSMYRFNGVDNRLDRQLESILMVLESFSGFENRILYDIVGHSGDEFNIKFVDVFKHPKNEAERLKILKTMIAHSQFCSSGDFTFEATRCAIQDLAREEADDYIVVVLSDANFDRYGLSSEKFSRILLDTDPNVNAFCIFIGTLGDQAVKLKQSLPFSKSFICLETKDIPIIMQKIFQSVMINQ